MTAYRPPRLVNAPPEPPTAEEWARFVAVLRQTREIQLHISRLEAKGDLPDELKNAEFLAAEGALTALLELLQNRPEIAADALDYPFFKLALAMADIGDGKNPTLLRPLPGNSRRIPGVEQITRVAAAIAVDAMMADGVSRNEAARKVAIKIHAFRLPIKTRNDADLEKTVLGWRDALSVGEGRGAQPLELDVWRRYKRAPEQFGATPGARASAMLALLANYKEVLRWR